MGQSYPVYLAKSDVVCFDECVKKDTDWNPVELTGLDERDFQIWLKPNAGSIPSFLSFLDSYCNVATIEPNRRSSAVVLFRANDRIFALTFGDGRFLLALENFENNFGVMTASYDFENRSLKEIAAVVGFARPYRSRKQAIGRSAWRTIPLPLNESWGSQVTYLDTRSESEGEDRTHRGGVCAYWPGPIDLPELPTIAATLYQRYEAAAQSPDAIRWGSMERLPHTSGIVRMLYDELDARLPEIHQGILLSLPSDMETRANMEVIEMRKGESVREIAEFSWESINTDIADMGDLTWKGLKSVELVAADEDGSVAVFGLQRSIVADVKLGERTYYLRDGEWYLPPSHWLNWIDERLDFAEITSNFVELPAWSSHWNEADYNAACARVTNYSLLDRTIFSKDGAKSKLEPCDLLTASGDLIHVKKYTGSASIAYLARQAAISAGSLANNSKFQNWLTQIEIAHGVSASGRERNVVMAIATVGQEPLSKVLPLSAKVALLEAAQEITAYGMRSQFYRIPISDQEYELFDSVEAA